MLNNYYPTHVHLNFDEFADVFCSVLPDEKPYFKLMKTKLDNKDPFVDIFECLAAFILFCGELLKTKADFLFRLFDFDQSSKIS
jgi:hypothetical protein